MRRFASLFGRRGVLAAAIVAGGVLVLAAAQELVGAATTSLFVVGAGPIPPMWLESIWGGAAVGIYAFRLPFALGVFASLWLVAPVAAELRLAHVVTRSVLAAGIGASLVVVVRTVWDSIGALSVVGPWFGHAFPELPFESLGQSLVRGVQAGIGAFVYQFVAVMLGSIFLWIWLRDHPSRHAVSGMLDEV